jgi:hypothetical protein
VQLFGDDPALLDQQSLLDHGNDQHITLAAHARRSIDFAVYCDALDGDGLGDQLITQDFEAMLDLAGDPHAARGDHLLNLGALFYD